jgi:hypothetical protein
VPPEEATRIAQLSGAAIAGPRIVRQYMKDLGLIYTKEQGSPSNVKTAKGRSVART